MEELWEVTKILIITAIIGIVIMVVYSNLMDMGLTSGKMTKLERGKLPSGEMDTNRSWIGK
jgi:hypothetical protein